MGAEAEQVDCSVIWGQSNNSRGFWRNDARKKLGWAPLDSSDSQAERVRGKVTDKLEKNGKKRVALDLETVNHRDEVTTVARAEAELPD